MRSVALTLLVSCALCVAPTGCMYSPYGNMGGYGGYQTYPGAYGGYPGGGYPTYPSGGFQTLTPGEQYVPGQQVLPGGSVYPGQIQPGTVIPNSGQPTYQPGTGGLQPIPDSGGSAPPFGSGNVNVPDPYMNSTMNSPTGAAVTDIQPANHAAAEPVQSFNEVARPMDMTEPVENPWGAEAETYSPPVSQSEPQQGLVPLGEPQAIGNIPSAQDTGFEFQPPTINSAGNTEAEPNPFFQANKSTPATLEPFGHDEQYRWLRGVVSKDPADGSWSIVYSDNPTTNDKLAGHVALSQSPYLNELADGDVVELQGTIDPVARDAGGKPVYVISSLSKLTSAPQ